MQTTPHASVAHASVPHGSAATIPAHELFARLGKRVLRPGGIELTRDLLANLAISPHDEVVEVAPGRGSTTEMVLAASPASYIAVDRDAFATEQVAGLIDESECGSGTGDDCRAIHANALDTGLPSASADVVFGEAYLTMQPNSVKHRILDELARVLRPGGRFAIHEMVLLPDDITDEAASAITDPLTASSHVRVTPLTAPGWVALLAEHGIVVTRRLRVPLHLLEPRRLITDEGFVGSARFATNLIRDRAARRRVLEVRRAMAANARNIGALGLIGVRSDYPTGD